MCGIAGYIDLRGAPGSAKLATAMADTLAHRGPDDAGVWTSGAVAFGHRRLAIIDLSDAGHQPMVDGDLALVFNGEIYNHVELRAELETLGHVFRSQCDTEVILHAYRAWGPECVTRFNGMWALALWDESQRRMWLSRDRFGVKPLFVAHLEGKAFVFASELKAMLAAFPELARIDRQSAYEFLEAGALDWSSRTFLEDARSLEPAHNLLVDLDGRQRRERYWDFDCDRARRDLDFRDPVTTFRELLVDSVRLRLRADVDVGTCLSGGLDSSAIVSISAKQLGRRGMHAISSFHSEQEANEEPFARAVAEDTGVLLHPVRPDVAGLARELDRMLWHQERPARTASLYSQWEVMREASRHVKVLLDGQGADELLGGYHAFFPAHVLSQLARAGRERSVENLVRLARTYPSLRRLSSEPILRRVARALLPTPVSQSLAAVASLLRLKAPPLPPIVRPEFASGEVSEPSVAEVFGDPLLDLLHHRFFVVGLPSLLHLEDRSSMAFSVEGRLPFTDDHRLVEFAMALPADWRIRGNVTKFVLRESQRGILTESVRTRADKMGFPTPLGAWLRRESDARKLWHSLDVGARGIADGDAAAKLMEEHVNGRADRSDVLFRMFTLELWCRRFIDAAGAPPQT